MMKIRILVFVILALVCCKKDGGSPEENGNGIRQITLRVNVKDANNQPVTEGFVKVFATVGLDDPFGGWYNEEDQQTNALNYLGYANFNYPASRIIPSLGFIVIREIDVLNRSLQIVNTDTLDFQVQSGQTRNVEYILE